jgi:carbon monoxide dehydrogenase subunit G
MSVVVAEIDIAAPPEAVWQVIMDPDRLHEWVTIDRGVRNVSSRPLGPGASLEQSLCLRGVTFSVRWKVGEWDPPHRAVWEGRGPARSRASIIDVLEETGSGSRLFYRNEFKAPLGPLGAVASRALVGGVPQREADRSLRSLKALLEARTPAR